MIKGKILRLLIILVSASLTACALSEKKEDSQDVHAKEAQNVVINELNEDQPQVVVEEAVQEIPVVVNSAVKHWISYFQNRGRRHMEKYLHRSTRYEKLMKEVLQEEGLPEDLIYVPLIESGFSSSAYSHRSAVGYWQFIRDTGRRYGLKINRYVDERSDPLLSTRAAAAYFKSLYSLFGDWYLALAAYNTGENRVKRAVMRDGTRDFWVLARNKRLYRETRNYVPKFLAALLIAKSPHEFGFSDVEYKAPLEYDRVYTTRPISLSKLSRNIGVNFKELKSLNTRYLTDYVPIYRGGKSLIRVPKGYLLEAHAALSKSHSKSPPRYVSPRKYWHVVRRGDTISEIAVKYGVKTRDLRSLNRLNRQSLIRIGQRLKIPRRSKQAYSQKKVKKGGYHIVRRGDTVSEIAVKYGTSVKALKKINQIGRRSVLQIGQKLKLPNKKLPNKKGSVHVVKKGDTLWDLAKKYKVSLRKLRDVNSLSLRSKLKVGKSLIIP